jgi:hypothetical protein
MPSVECKEKHFESTRRCRARRWYPFYETLVSYGLPRAEAAVQAVQMADPARCCAICGIPQSLIYRLSSERKALPGGFKVWRRLTIDRITPGRVDGATSVRLLDYYCNTRRGAARYTDAQVRTQALRFWNFWLGERVVSTW